jgi:hypothetical protein
MREKKFASDDEVTEKVNKWLRVQNSNWYTKGIDALVSRWRKAVQFDGDLLGK